MCHKDKCLKELCVCIYFVFIVHWSLNSKKKKKNKVKSFRFLTEKTPSPTSYQDMFDYVSILLQLVCQLSSIFKSCFWNKLKKEKHRAALSALLLCCTVNIFLLSINPKNTQTLMRNVLMYNKRGATSRRSERTHFYPTHVRAPLLCFRERKKSFSLSAS